MSSRQHPSHEVNIKTTCSPFLGTRARHAPTAALVSLVLLPAFVSLAGCGGGAAGSARGGFAGPDERPAPVPTVTAEEWDPINDPLRLGRDFKLDFDELPLSGSVERKPWADSYWPSQQGGLSSRWYGDADLAADSTLARSEVRDLSRDELARLSPAEKYDIYKGRYDYPLFKSERQRTSPSDLPWEGLCHGWASVSYLMREPRAVTLRGEGGVEVPFGSSDVKALLTYVQSVSGPGKSRSLGARCDIDIDDGGRNRPECRDVNAGTLHVVLANRIGLLKKIFVADTTRDLEVWNYPVHAFESRVIGQRSPSSRAASTAVREISVETRMTYVTSSAPSFNRIAARAAPNTTSRYRYWLELDKEGRIVGGSWITRERPDFLWAQNRPVFEGYFSDVETIYEASIRNR